MEPETRFPLRCHPETPGPFVESLQVCVHRSHELRVTFDLRGDLAQLALPTPGPIQQGDRLWEHTCFEVFIGLEGDESYHEFNASPANQWASYAFRGRRDRIEGAPSTQPTFHITCFENQAKMELQIPLEALSPEHLHGTLRIGISAILETRDGLRSFWALHHAAGKPDFHHPEAFALVLPSVSAGYPSRHRG